MLGDQPRSHVHAELQVDLILHLYDKLSTLYKDHMHDPDRQAQYPRPSFKVVVLYVDEATSIARQMNRSTLAAKHNQKVLEAGAGTLKCAYLQRTQSLEHMDRLCTVQRLP